jgi:hypothetical protein
MNTTERTRWGILAPGGIAKAFADGVAGSQTATLVSLADTPGNEFGQCRAIGQKKGFRDY